MITRYKFLCHFELPKYFAYISDAKYIEMCNNNIPEFNSLTSVDMALVTLSAATNKSFRKDRPKLLFALLEPLPGKLFVLNADLTSKISIFFA